MNIAALHRQSFGLLALVFMGTLPNAARAIVGDITMPTPPANPACSASSAQMTPGLNVNQYTFSGNCWINLAADKFDVDHPSWYMSKVSATGSYNSQNQNLSETMTFSTPSGPITVNNSAWCDADPWMTPEDCTLDPESLRSAVRGAVGLDPGNMSGRRGPLSLIVVSPTIIHALISKQESKPPRPPVNVDPVVWPVDNGKSTRVTLTWRAGDMSGNRWVMQFDVQQSTQKTDSDSAYSTAGQVLGLGPKPSFSTSDANRTFVFTLPSEVKPIGNYYFRICARNDADTQCSSPVPARQPTKQEQMARVSGMHVVTGSIGSDHGNPAPRSNDRTGPIALGGRQGTPEAGGSAGARGAIPLGGAQQRGPVPLGVRPGTSGGSGGGAAAGGNGTGPLTPAGNGAPTGVGGPNSSQGPVRLGMARSAVPNATPMTQPGSPAGAGGRPGMVAIPDLAIGRGMLVHDRLVAWGGTSTVALRADATHQCPLPVSFQYMNAGNGPATNVSAEILDSLAPTPPVASQNLASMTAGQSGTLSGVMRIGAQAAPRQIKVLANVREAGTIHETNKANDHGVITLNVTCRP